MMRRNCYFFVMICISCYDLIACMKEDDQLHESEVAEQLNDSNEDLDEAYDQLESNKSTDLTDDEDHYINGKVLLLEDENIIRIEADTNLVEDTEIGVRFEKAYGMLSSIS